MTDGVIVVNAAQKVVLLNNVAEILTGSQLEDALGKDINQILHIINERSRKPVENPVDKVLVSGNIYTMIESDIIIVARFNSCCSYS